MGDTGMRKRLRVSRVRLGGLIFVAGMLTWFAFEATLDWTSREAICISCHEAQRDVVQKYRNTPHFANRNGVRATCPDCHVPRELGPRILRAFQQSNEVFQHLIGSIDTPEKFNARRGELAQHEWDRLRRSDSRECRNCHNFNYMGYGEQGRRRTITHQLAIQTNGTCIDCHMGVVHIPPADPAR
jgi:cytochrome c-type protein NapC